MNLADMNYIKILKDDNQKLESRIKIKDKIIRELQNDNHKTNKEIYKIREENKELKNILEIERDEGECYIDDIKKENDRLQKRVEELENYILDNAIEDCVHETILAELEEYKILYVKHLKENQKLNKLINDFYSIEKEWIEELEEQ